MATYLGSGVDEFSLLDYLSQGPIPVLPFVNRYWDHDDSDTGESYAPLAIQSQFATRSRVSAEKSQTGQVVPSFTGDFYNRIHIFPNPAPLGSVLEETTATIEIWNAFFSQTTWDSYTTLRFEGLAVETNQSPPPQVVIDPLQNHLFNLTATTIGPATISAEIHFDMPGRFVQTLEITGRRSKLFPFITSWEKNPKETFEWKTNIVETEQWEEYRYRLRELPRRQFEFGLGAVARGYSDLRVSLLSAQNSEYAVPLWMYEEKLTASANAGNTTIYLSTADSDFAADTPAMLYLSSEEFETVQILSVASDRLELDPNKAVGRYWPARTSVIPLRLSRFQDRISLSSKSPADATSTVKLTTINSETSFESPVLPEYLGYKIIADILPNWRSARKYSYLRKIGTMDDNIHPIEYHELSFRYGEEQEFEWYLNGRDKITLFKALLNHMAGRHVPVWVPSWHNDFPIDEPYSAGQKVVRIQTNFASKFMQANIADPAHVRLRLIDGTELYDRLVSAAPSPAFPERDEMVLENGWANEFRKGEVENFCLLTLCRLNSDKTEIEWYTPQMARAKTTFVYVPEQPQ